jgi:hypothetical protein
MRVIVSLFLSLHSFFGKGLYGFCKKIRSSAWLEHYTDNVGVSSSNLLGSTDIIGGLAQLARASALHAEGHRFDSDILHQVGSIDKLIG